MDSSQKEHYKPVDSTKFADALVEAALGDGLPSNNSVGASSAKPIIVVACAPKSGSTFLTNVLSRTTNLPYFRLSSAYGTNEHDLYLPALYMAQQAGCVSQLHMKGTFHNASLLKKFGIKPVILIRNIEDTVASLVDDFRDKERHMNFGSGDFGFSFIWQDHAIAGLNQAALVDCIIDLAIPWYVNFYVSWYRLCERHDIEAMWVTYEDLMQNKRKTVCDILTFTGFCNDVDIDDDLLGQRFSKFNKGKSGRGEDMLSEAQKARIRQLFSYYPDVDFSKYGIKYSKALSSLIDPSEKNLNADNFVDFGEENHKSGNLQIAEQHYRKALELDPGHPGALYFLANIAYEDGRLRFAKQLIETLLQGEPNDVEAWDLLGRVYLKEGDFRRTVESLNKAVEIHPGYVRAYYSLGEAYGRNGDVDIALANFQRAIALNPKFPEAHFAIGNVFEIKNNLEAALSSYGNAIAGRSNFALAYERMGTVLISLGRNDDAVALYRKAISEIPESAFLYTALGAALVKSNKVQEAAVSYERAIAIDSNSALAYANLGVIRVGEGRLNEAISSFQQALALNSQDARSWANLAKAYRNAGKLVDAIDCLKKAIALSPDDTNSQSYLLYLMSYVSDYPREKNYADHVAFGERVESTWRKNWFDRSSLVKSPKRLRVGFVSGDLHSHPVGFFFEGVLRELRILNGIDIVIYSTNAKVDALTERLKLSAHQWLPVFDLSEDVFEKRIRDDKIDILIDLSGHTPGNRLTVFARKPAPVQVTWLGYWNTTGLTAIDYILCDQYSVFNEEEKLYTEKPWYLPHTRLCFTEPAEKVTVGPLPAASAGYVTFGCFNNLLKITDKVVAIWARILLSEDGSRLLLKSPAFSESGIRNDVVGRFAAHGVTSDRLLLEAASPHSEYFATYNRVDIALDPFPFNGGTTTVDGIWMGVPVITLRGDSIVSRQGESILQNIGLQDWIAPDEDAYVEMAVKHAKNLTNLAHLRADLRRKLEASPLCNTKLFAENLESAFKQMWGA